MNTVFRTVYNAVTQSWVAVSEKTNTQGKKASTAVCLSSSFSGSLKKMRFSLLAAALLGVFAVGEANAATGDSNHNCYYNSTKRNFRCGSENETSAQNASIFGWNNKVNHDNTVTQSTEYISIAGYENTVNNYANNTNNSHHVSITGIKNIVSGENITASGNSNTITKASNSSAFGAENAITANHATAAGYQNAIKGGSSVAVGYKNITNSAYDTAVGSENKITGSSSVALGDSNIIYGNTSIAIGYNNKAGQSNYSPSSTTLGNSKYSHNIIIGDYNQAYSRNGVVIGTYSTIPASEQGTIANAATALGFNTKVSVQEGVALGAFSLADRSPGTFGKAPDSTKLTSAYLGENHTNDNTGAWKSTAGALAIGNKNATFENTNYYDTKTGVVTRQITGVAAGSEDTDAVNVAQLKELQNSIGTGGGGSFSPITVNSDSGNFSVSSGGNLKIVGGNNITTSASGGTLTINADLSGYATQQWVGQQGYLKNADLNGYATQQWVGQQGYLKNADLNGYATQTWVNNKGYQTAQQVETTITGKGYQTAQQVGNAIDTKLQGNATQQWVQQQGYLTNATLNGYATQQWVQQQGYLTNATLNGYATQTWVNNKGYQTAQQVETTITGKGYQNAQQVGAAIDSKLQGNATQQWVQQQGYLTNATLNGYATQSWVGQQGYQTAQQVGAAIDSKLQGNATQQWVQQQGYLTNATLNGYATQSWVGQQGYQTAQQVGAAIDTKLQGNATQQWVQQQGYLTNATLNGYATQQWVNDKGYQNQTQVNALIGNRLNGYATQSWVGEQGYQTAQQVETAITGKGYQTENQVNALIDGKGYQTATQVGSAIDSKLQGNATQQWVGEQGYLKNADLNGYATQNWVEQQGYLKNATLNGYATQQWVGEQGYLDAADKKELSDRISGLTTSTGNYSPITIQGNEGNGFQVASATTVNIKGDNQVIKTTAQTAANGDNILTISADLSGYATEQFVTDKGYQTEAEVNALINGKGYATEQFVTDQGYQTQTEVNALIDSKGYQTESQVNALINDKGYQTQSEVNALIGNRLNGYATQQWVGEQGYQTEEQVNALINNKGYQTQAEVDTLINDKGFATQQWVGQQGYQTATQVGNAIDTKLQGNATQQWVQQQGYLKNADLDGYATQQWVGQQGYQTAQQVGATIDSKLQGNATQQWVQQQGYLKNADLNGYATQTALNTEVNTLNTRIDNLALNSGSYSPINIKGDAGNGFQAASGSTVNIQGGNHITTTANGNTLTIDADLTGYATEQFVTDQGYQTQAEVNALINGKGYTTQQWVEEQGYLTAVDKTELEEKIKAGGVDLSDYSTTTQTQQWVKEQNYQTEKQVTSAIDNKLKGYATEDFVTSQGYQTAADVENTLKGKGYQTQNEVNALINGKNFATQQWVGEQGYLKNADLNGYATEEFVTNQGYQTAADVEKTVTSKGYQTQAQVDTAINNKLQGNATQQWVEEQEYAKQTAVNHLDEKLSNLVVTSGAYAPITLTGDKNENGVGLQMQSNGTVEIVGDDNQNITTEVAGGKLKVKLADEISVNQVNVGNGGVSLTADGNQSLSFGAGNTVTGTQSLAMGTGLTVSGNNSGAIGDPTVVTGDNAYSIGNNNNISTDNTYALGSNINATAANSVFLGDNAAYTAAGDDSPSAGIDPYATNDTDIGNIKPGTLQFAGGGTPAGVVSVGSVGSERRIQNVAAGKLSADSTDAVNGSQLYSVAEQVSQVANGGAGVVQYADENGVANGGVASNDVTVVGANPNAPVVIHNVSAGARPTDAVNVAQLQHSMAMSEARLNNRIDRVEKRANAGTAAAMAAGNLQNAMKPGGNSFSISGATFAGEAGYAMGYSTMSSDGKWGFNAFGNGDSRGRFGGGASVGFHW